MRRHEGKRNQIKVPERIRKERNKIAAKSLIGLLIAALFLMGAYMLYKRYLISKIISEATIEAGSPIDVSLFTAEQFDESGFITDVSGIDTTIPASYGLKVRGTDHRIEVSRDVILNIVDTTAPFATPVPQTVYIDELPAPEDTVTGITDLSAVTVEYANIMPDLLMSGEYDVQVKLTDSYGNESIIDVPFTVIDDHTAPVIEGAEDFEAFIGEAISYLDGVSVTDDYDQNPVIEVDTSGVNVTEEGYYPVTYTATDEHGNVSSVTVTLHLRIRPERYYEPEELYELARQIIEDNDICDDSMSDMEKVLRITAWVSTHLHYMMDSDKCDWTAGAYDALTTMYGDCFNYMAMCRAMYGAEGIESITVERYPINVSSHYWCLVNVDGRWYHCDACVFLSMTDISYIVMYTDDELDPYNNSYDPETLPEDITVATESVQDLLDYDNLTVRSEVEE